MVNYAVKRYMDYNPFRTSVINAMNYASMVILAGDTFDDIDYSAKRPFSHIKRLPASDYIEAIGDMFIDPNDVEWDNIAVVEVLGKSDIDIKPTKKEVIIDTPKEHLYLRAPQYPRYDTSKYWLSEAIGSEHFYMHPSLPIIPEKQGDVSCTTDVNKMTEKELLKLYPNHLIRTRAAVMYEPCGDIPLDKDLGLLIPIDGYTTEQIRENIIKYPHFFQLTRVLNDQEITFYKHIELNGEIKDTLEVWDSLPVSKVLPKTSEFIKEYIIRKYLLDRDNGVDHKFPLKGTLEPFLTLFAPAEFYKDYGDPAELMRTCVKARVSFFQSRNPYLARYLQVKQNMIPPNKTIDCPFKQYCRKSICKYVCADFAEFQYLLKRNAMLANTDIYTYPSNMLQQCSEWLTVASGSCKVVISDKTSEVASCLSYVAICNHWKGNAFHCGVYHLDFAEWVRKDKEQFKNVTVDEDFEYINIFIESAKVLIISNLDFVIFNDYTSQNLHNIISSRKADKTTIIVSPKLNSLSGSGNFLPKLKDNLGKEVIN